MARGGPGDIVIMGAVVAFIGLAAYWDGLNTYRLKKTIEYTPTTKTIAASPGIVEISGAAREAARHVSPYNNEKCAYYCTKLYRYEKHGKSSSWKLKKLIQSQEPIMVEDDTGRALVQPQEEGGGFLGLGAWKKSLVKKDTADEGQAAPGMLGSLFGAKQDRTGKLCKFLEKNAAEYVNDSHQLKVEETFIKDGDSLYVIGEAKFEEGQGGAAMLKIVPDERRKIFCIADGSEKNAMSELGMATLLGVFGAPFAVAGGACLAAAGFYAMKGMEFFGQASVGLGVLAFFGMYAWAFAMHMMEFYNGTITLKTSVERAKANVDVLLKRRAELLPNLVEVVRAASKYEKRLQQEIANMRASGMESDEKSLFALSENYPSLQANQNYMELQRQLVKTEEWLAASRAYVADSIMLYNTRIMQFPYSVFAGLMKMQLIAQDEALR